MDEGSWRARIAEVEQYYSERSSWGHPERMYLPYALDCMAYVCECVEADFYQLERPEPQNPWTARAIKYFDEKWRRT